MNSIQKSYNFEQNKYSNKVESKNRMGDIRNSSDDKTSYHVSQQKSKHGLGICYNRKIDTINSRPSPYGLVPSAVRPNQAMVWEYEGATHTFANTVNTNLKMDKLY